MMRSGARAIWMHLCRSDCVRLPTQQGGSGRNLPPRWIGEPMPSFLLPDETAQMVRLDNLLARGPVAVTFHRGHWCPYCRINIDALAKAQKELPSGGGQIVAIMPDRQKFIAGLKS